MWIHFLRRLLLTVPIALGVSSICFALVYLAPGDPLSAVVPANATPDDIAMLRNAYGFDQPIHVQYVRWLSKAVRGDLGKSLQTGGPVGPEVLTAFCNTLVIAMAATVLALLLALLGGALSAWYEGGPFDRVSTGISVAALSLPNYWVGILLIIAFSVEAQLLPASGMGANAGARFDFGDPDQYRHALLPVLALALVPTGIILRSTRAAVAGFLSQDFTVALRARGLAGRRILWHAFVNAAPQILAVVGLQFGYLVGGSILVETVFNWPGIGSLLNKSILTRDVPTLQGSVLLLAMWFVLINLVVDVQQALLDPRIGRD